MNKTFIYLFFLFSLYLTISAQKIDIKFEHITTKDGLSQTTVNSIVQDIRGFMWFGTMNGLNRFDGYNIIAYQNDPDNSKSLSHNYINSLFVDSHGILWIGTDGGGLNRYNRENDDFTIYRNIPDDDTSISDNRISKIYEDKAGTIWIGTLNGLNKFNRDKKVFNRYINNSNKIFLLKNNMIHSIFEDSSGTLWIGTLRGLNKFDRIQKKFFLYNDKSNKIKFTTLFDVRTLWEDKTGLLWIGVDGVDKNSGGLFKFDKKREIIVPFKSFLDIKQVWTIFEDSKNIIWVGSRGKGLFKIKDNKLTHYINTYNNPGGINDDKIRDIYEDRSGIIWIGTVGGGINKIDKQKEKFNSTIIFPNQLNRQNITITSLKYGYQSGILWVGTRNGIFGFNKEIERIIHYKNIPDQINSLSDNIVRSICIDKSFLWIGTKHKGVNLLNIKNKTFIQYKNIPNNPGSLSHNTITKIYRDRSGVIWIGTHGGGLNRFNRKEETFSRYIYNPASPDCISSNYIKSFYEDRSGTLWVGTRDAGINRFNRKKETFIVYKRDFNDRDSLSNNFVNCIIEDSSGVLWIGTDGGLNKFINENKFITYTKKNGLPDDIIQGMLEDKMGNIWLSTNKGLSKFDPLKETFKNYNTDDGLISNGFNNKAIFKNKKGKMFFGGKNGFNSFFPEDIKDNPYIPPIRLTSFKKFYKEVKFKQNISEIKELELNYTDSIISFEFAALNYTNTPKNQYSYLLEGFNEKWINLDNKHDIAFTNLDPGKYTLKIRGSNNDGVWNNKGLELEIIINPPFWKIWWFTLLSVILFGAASYILINISKKYLTLIAFWKKNNYIGHYKIVDKIASGGMGIIYKSVNVLDKSINVAIKVIREEFMQNPEQRKRFINEAMIIDKLNHKNIVKVIERGEHNNQLFIVMEYLDGETLTDRILKENKISINAFIEIAIQLTSTIISIHKQGIIHRDLKPDNIMLVKEEDQIRTVKILDFGLAKTRNLTQLTESGIIMGTINYISPEQISGISTKASDIYSLGIIFYEMTTAEKPFMAETSIDIINQILKDIPIEPVTFNPAIPHKVNKLIMSMLEKSPESRPTAEIILNVLNQLSKKFN